MYSQRRIESARAETYERWKDILDTEVNGISVGASFPDFLVWAADGSGEANGVHELLPSGGFLVMASPSCVACLETADAFQRAVDRLPETPCPIVLVFEGEVPGSLVAGLRALNVSFPIYADTESVLRHVHHVVHNPAYFSLDSAGAVLYAGFGPQTIDELTHAIQTFCSAQRRLK